MLAPCDRGVFAVALAGMIINLLLALLIAVAALASMTTIP